MKLSQLGFFCAVVERGTIAAAAEQLHCVPSNITTRLRELEGQLGIALFNRERNRLLVTPEGRLLYRHARRLLALADETAALFAGDQAHGALRVGALDVALANHLPQRLARYRRESPGVELHIRPEHSLLLERLLMEGELDLIVTDGPIEHPLLASRLASASACCGSLPPTCRHPLPRTSPASNSMCSATLATTAARSTAGWRKAVSSRVQPWKSSPTQASSPASRPVSASPACRRASLHACPPRDGVSMPNR